MAAAGNRIAAVTGGWRHFLPILGHSRPRRVLAPEGSLWQEPAACRGLLGPILTYRACCRSSVVEHSIGNGEVDSSILSGSTIFQCRINSYLDEAVGPISTARLRRLGKKAIADRCESIDRKRRDELLSDMMLSGLGELRDIPTKGRAKKRFFFV